MQIITTHPTIQKKIEKMKTNPNDDRNKDYKMARKIKINGRLKPKYLSSYIKYNKLNVPLKYKNYQIKNANIKTQLHAAYMRNTLNVRTGKGCCKIMKKYIYLRQKLTIRKLSDSKI